MRASSPWSLLLPAQALRVAVRNFWPLLAWFSAGFLLHDLLLRGAVEAGKAHKAAGLVVLSFALLASLATTIAMLLVLIPDLPTLQRLTGGDQSRSWRDEHGRLVKAIGQTLLPFLIFYSAWGLFVEEVQEYNALGLEDGRSDLTVYLGFSLPLVIASVSFGLRALFEGRFERTKNPVLGVLTALFETIFMFFAVFSIDDMVGNFTDWLTTRVAWVEAREGISAAIERVDGLASGGGIPELSAVGGWIASYLSDLKDGLILPLLWLSLAAVVYGQDMMTERGMVAGSRVFSPLRRIYRVLSAPMRRLGTWGTAGLRDKYVPMLAGLRLVLRSGPTTYLFFCVCYLGLEHGVRWAWIGVTELIGPHGLDFWPPVLVGIDFARDALHAVLRVALLAVGFDIVLRRVTARTAARTTPHPEPSPPGSAHPLSRLPG